MTVEDFAKHKGLAKLLNQSKCSSRLTFKEGVAAFSDEALLTFWVWDLGYMGNYMINYGYMNSCIYDIFGYLCSVLRYALTICYYMIINAIIIPRSITFYLHLHQRQVLWLVVLASFFAKVGLLQDVKDEIHESVDFCRDKCRIGHDLKYMCWIVGACVLILKTQLFHSMHDEAESTRR